MRCQVDFAEADRAMHEDIEQISQVIQQQGSLNEVQPAQLIKPRRQPALRDRGEDADSINALRRLCHQLPLCRIAR